jgi:ABC-type glycerol-3-phosphate transport system substrate-binding protein
MKDKKWSWRGFLCIFALVAIVAGLASCAGEKATDTPKAAEAETTAAPAEPTEPPAAEPVEIGEAVLEIQASNPEYNNAERQIWDLFEEEYPNIKVELFDVNEDTQDAWRAKVAGGYTPCFAQMWAFNDNLNADNYEEYLDLSTIEGLPWDKYGHNPIEMSNKLLGWGPRALDPFKGFAFTWMYHEDLMEEAGLNPREDVKTVDDLWEWLEAGQAWVETRDDIDFFWDQAWHTWVFGQVAPHNFGLMYPDGQTEHNVAMWDGEIAVNSPDSPVRHFVEFYKEAYDRGLLPENFWTREWETDMEASYISKKSVVMWHGPWPWDKAMAADPTIKQAGIPGMIPAAGTDQWVQHIWPPNYGSGQTTVPARAVEQPWWPACEQAIIWWNSADAVKLRGEVLGQDSWMEGVTIELDSPQWNGVLKDIGSPGGLWEDVEWVSEMGEINRTGDRIPGSPGMLDWESGAITEQFAAVMKGEQTVQDFLDWAQDNYNQSFE